MKAEFLISHVRGGGSSGTRKELSPKNISITRKQLIIFKKNIYTKNDRKINGTLTQGGHQAL